MGVAETDQQLIDVHAHFLTDSYVSAARAAGHVHPDGMAGWPKWSAEEHLRLMDRWGVATAMLSISSPGTHFGDDAAARRLTREVNEGGAAISRAHPGRFGHFASLPLPDVAGALDELGFALDEFGSDGITVETNSAGAYLGDDRYEPLYRELNRRRAVVFVHPTSPPCAEMTALGRPRPMLDLKSGHVFRSFRRIATPASCGEVPQSRGGSAPNGCHQRMADVTHSRGLTNWR